MLISKKNNKGFSLVEVIVSMLVLSIVISSVLTAFSLSAKANAKTKKVQSAESLMEDLQELAGAVKDSSQYVSTCETLYGTSATETQTWTEAVPVEKFEFDVNKGSYTFKVEVIRDTKPADYTNMNNKQVLTFGESGSNAVMIDASTKGNVFVLGEEENGYDAMALETFATLHQDKINEENAALDPDDPLVTPAVAKTEDEIKGLIDRDVLLETVAIGEEKMQLVAYFSYTVADSLDLPDGESRQINMEFFRTAEYHKPDSAVAGAQKLDRVYVLYSPCAWEDTTGVTNQDVRIVDACERLGADVYLVYQEAGSVQSINSTLVNTSLDSRFSGKSLKVSFGRNGDTIQTKPYRVDLYSPTEIIWSSVDNVTLHQKELVAKKNELRVQTIMINITDSDGIQLASEEIACLQ